LKKITEHQQFDFNQPLPKTITELAKVTPWLPEVFPDFQEDTEEVPMTAVWTEELGLKSFVDQMRSLNVREEVITRKLANLYEAIQAGNLSRSVVYLYAEDRHNF
jgi:hypothetical protein